MNDRLLYTDITVKKIIKLSRIIIYGAGVTGQALKKCLEAEPYNKRVEYFIVKCKDGNPEYVGLSPILQIEDITEADKAETIIVALNEKHMALACEDLKKNGFHKLIMINAAGDTWSYIKGNYFIFNQEKCYLPFEPLLKGGLEAKNQCRIKIYVAKSIYDKNLKNKLSMKSYENEIQVGASLADRQICELRDDMNDNISYKNRQYCELTALYWIWKNDESEYAGLSHYRRRFDIDESEISEICKAGIDVIVTIPIINLRGIGRQYSIDHSAQDWEILCQEVHRLCPEYDNSLHIVQNQYYFYAYNMFIMRKNILDCYCRWLFPILEACEERIGEKDDVYQNRYIGFLAERLLNVFLYYNKNRVKICVAKKKYLD